MTATLIITAFCTVMLGGLIQTIRQYGALTLKNWSVK